MSNRECRIANVEVNGIPNAIFHIRYSILVSFGPGKACSFVRSYLGLCFCVCLACLATAVPAPAQDTIRYLDRKAMKETTAAGTIQDENPSAVSYKPGGGAGTKEIPALDITDVIYEVPGGVRLTYRSAVGEETKANNPTTKDNERTASLNLALKNYQEVLAKLSAEKNKFAERHVQFKIGRLLARLAEDNPEQMDAALESLANFVKKYPDGWQITQAAKVLARLQMSKGDPDAARKTYETLAAVDNLPKQVKQDCDFLIADALLAGKKYAEAQKLLQGIVKGLAVDDPVAVRGKIYLAECLGVSGKLPEAVTELEAIIKKTTDKNLLGAAYNALGDCYRLNGRGKDALWQYLWVDVIYHQDKQEHQRAMEQLVKLFDEQGDKFHARQYRERLKREMR
jgi:tetratricopeptide (TPR) repeat protein